MGIETSSAIPAVRERYAQAAANPATNAMPALLRSDASRANSTQQVKNTSEKTVAPKKIKYGLMASIASKRNARFLPDPLRRKNIQARARYGINKIEQKKVASGKLAG